ncbi:hypothetical protein RB213_014482 [Colletotrichum asianum]
MSATLVIMASILLAAFLVTGDFKQIWVFHTTKCLNISMPNTLIHLLLNALSTIVLASSNFFMQICNAPSRQEIDAAHAKHDWLDIGIPSWRNAFRLPWFKFTAWAILFLTSIPIHMIFNSSVLLIDNRVGDYRMTIATQGYIEGAAYFPPGASLITSPPLTTALNSSDQYHLPGLGNSSLAPDESESDRHSEIHTEYLEATAGEAQKWERLEPSVCVGMYTENGCAGLRDYRGVIMIVNGPGWNEPKRWNLTEGPKLAWDSFVPLEKNSLFISTQCRMVGELRDFTPICRSDCNSILTTKNPDNDRWLLNFSNWSQLGELDWFRWKASLYSSTGNTAISVYDFGLEHFGRTVEISHCMAEPRLSDCSLAISKPLFLALTVSISLKLVMCGIVMWTLGSEESLVTPGDVVASFLSSPDDNMEIHGPITQMQIRTNSRGDHHQSLWNRVALPAR